MFSFQIFVCSRRELLGNSILTADADATQLDSWVASASAVCILGIRRQFSIFTAASCLSVRNAKVSYSWTIISRLVSLGMAWGVVRSDLNLHAWAIFFGNFWGRLAVKWLRLRFVHYVRASAIFVCFVFWISKGIWRIEVRNERQRI